MSNAADLGTNTVGSTLPYSGPINNYAGTNIVASQGDIHIPYQGYDTTYGAINVQNVIGSAGDQSYGGPNSIGVAPITVIQNIQLDNLIVYPYPKDQQIYYKLRGFNSNTSLYETWIIVEEIVPRPEIFDPTRSVPNIDLNVFFSPPSGNTLSNIRIVGRWIQ